MCKWEKKEKCIISLEKVGEVIEHEENLLKHASEYYSELFGPIEQHDIHLDPSIWNNSSRLSESDNKILCQLFLK